NVMGVPWPAPNGCSRITFILAALPHPPPGPVRIPFGRIGRLRNQGRVQMQFRTILAASAAVIIGAAAAQAAEVAALSGDNTISIVNTSSKSVTKTWKIQGVSGKVLGIDVRPADGMLYAVGADGGIYTVDLASGKATMKSKLDKMLAADSWATV